MKTYTVKSEFFDITGEAFVALYPGGRQALVLMNEEGPEKLSINLAGHGIEQPEGHVHIGTYSEYAGLPEAVEAAGLATKVGNGPVHFGDFDASAWLMKLSDEVLAQLEEASR